MFLGRQNNETLLMCPPYTLLIIVFYDASRPVSAAFLSRVTPLKGVCFFPQRCSVPQQQNWLDQKST